MANSSRRKRLRVGGYEILSNTSLQFSSKGRGAALALEAALIHKLAHTHWKDFTFSQKASQNGLWSKREPQLAVAAESVPNIAHLCWFMWDAAGGSLSFSQPPLPTRHRPARDGRRGSSNEGDRKWRAINRV